MENELVVIGSEVDDSDGGDRLYRECDSAGYGMDSPLYWSETGFGVNEVGLN